MAAGCSQGLKLLKNDWASSSTSNSTFTCPFERKFCPLSYVSSRIKVCLGVVYPGMCANLATSSRVRFSEALLLLSVGKTQLCSSLLVLHVNWLWFSL